MSASTGFTNARTVRAPVLVTGAAGKTGTAVIRALRAGAIPVRALVRREDQAATAKAAGADEVTVGDLESRPTLAAALESCAAVYFICPNMHPDETRLAMLAMSVAKQTGVERFVYHSVLHPQIERMPHHWSKLRSEEALLESGLDWSILQPAPYMENLLPMRDEVLNDGVLRVPYPVASRIALVALQDVAAAAARVLLDDSHVGATYPLVGRGALSQVEVARVLSKAIGRRVEALERSEQEIRAGFEAVGTSRYASDSLVAMFDYYGRFGLDGSPRLLAWLLGRPPLELAAFVQSAFQR